jgi:hypothetical protein
MKSWTKTCLIFNNNNTRNRTVSLEEIAALQLYKILLKNTFVVTGS